MQQMLMTVVLLSFLAGCAQPQLDPPRANGTYLVIENGQAWAVMVDNGKRVEEPGTVVDMIRLPNKGSAVAASYVIETANCGRMQWLSEHSSAADGATSRMSLHRSNSLANSNCLIAEGLSRVWTVLDYSG